MGSCSSKDTSKKRSNKKPATRRFKKKVDNGFDEIQLKKILDSIFDKYDEDKDERLSKDEIRKMINQMMGKNKKDLSKEEVDTLIDNLLDKADKDKNGSVNRNEFYLFYKMM